MPTNITSKTSINTKGYKSNELVNLLVKKTIAKLTMKKSNNATKLIGLDLFKKLANINSFAIFAV